MVRLIAIAFGLFAAALNPSHSDQALAADKVALVIGNAEYQHDPRLRNPANDAREMQTTLEALGFDVTPLFNASRREMWRALTAFRREAGTADTAVLFFSGHGMEIRGENYLIPVDAQLSHPDEAEGEAITLRAAARMAAGAARLSVVIVDACRNNSFPSSTKGSKGMRRPDTEARQVIAFATAPGTVAQDGRGRLSPYTRALTERLREDATEDVRILFSSLAAKTAEYAGGPQIPHLELASVLPRGGLPLTPASLTGGDAGAAQPDDRPVEEWTPSRADFQEAQRELERLRLYDGGVDGLWGRGSRSALARFQRDAQLSPADGLVSLASLAALRSTPTPEVQTPQDFASRLLSAGRGTALKECDACPEMVVIPAGSFRMGSPENEAGRYDDEGPQRAVQVSQFALGRTEITRGEYRRFVEATGRDAGGGCWWWNREKPDGAGWEQDDARSWRDPGYSQRDDHPAVCLSWEDANAYVAWLNGQVEGTPYRLPSEAEWEYAARARTKTSRYWGDDSGAEAGCGYANGSDLTRADEHNLRREPDNVFMCEDGYVHTAPVGSFDANSFQLVDMLGNVWEWTEDCWNGSYASAPTNGSAWMSGDCSRAVLRGGSWLTPPQVLRSANRSGSPRVNRDDNVGFRVARTLPTR